jgi:hypothetical protein
VQLLVPMPKCLKFKNKGLCMQYRYQKYLQKDLRKNQQLLTTTAIADMKLVIELLINQLP